MKIGENNMTLLESHNSFTLTNYLSNKARIQQKFGRQKPLYYFSLLLLFKNIDPEKTLSANEAAKKLDTMKLPGICGHGTNIFRVNKIVSGLARYGFLTQHGKRNNHVYSANQETINGFLKGTE